MIISISRCCGPQKIEKILINHKKLKNVNTKCDFRQFRLNSKSYNFAFCVFFVFLTDRKCRPLSSFSKSGGFGWVRNVIYERQNLTEVFGFWFQLWSRSGSIFCSRIGGVPFVLPVRLQSCPAQAGYWRPDLWRDLDPIRSWGLSRALSNVFGL